MGIRFGARLPYTRCRVQQGTVLAFDQGWTPAPFGVAWDVLKLKALTFALLEILAAIGVT